MKIRFEANDNHCYFFDYSTGKSIMLGEYKEYARAGGPNLLDVSITNRCNRCCDFCYRHSNPLEVVEMLENSGFTYVTIEEISDLSLDEECNAILVTDIRLEEKPTFDEKTKYAYDKHIVVVYHSLKLSAAPVTSKEAKGTNYADVMDKFKDAGFVNVKTNVIYDIITGWVTDDGEVKSITINGDEDFDAYDEYRPDTEVVITYHTYKKNDPNK